MNNLLNICNQIHKDIQPLEIPKEEYLALCVTQRLDDTTKQYNDNFDKILDGLLNQTLQVKDFNRLVKIIKSFSNTELLLLTKLSFEISRYQKNLIDRYK